MAEKSNVLEIIQGIQQAASNAYDGALDENGEPLKVGLQREEGHPILDKRVMDGFGVCFSGNTLRIKYQGEITLKEFHRGDFEGEIAQRLQDISSFLKKEYKKITGNGLTLTKVKDSEPQMLVQSTSRIHSWVQAQQDFKIGGIPDEPEMGHTVEERLDDTFKKFLGMGKDKFPNTKKPENVSGKRDEKPSEKKKLAEGVSKKKLLRAIKIIQEEMTIDGRKIGPKAETWLKKKLSANPKVAKAFGLSGEEKKEGGDAAGSGEKIAQAIEPSKVEKAAAQAAKNPEAFKKLAKNDKADDAIKAAAEESKREAEQIEKAAAAEKDAKVKKRIKMVADLSAEKEAYQADQQQAMRDFQEGKADFKATFERFSKAGEALLDIQKRSQKLLSVIAGEGAAPGELAEAKTMKRRFLSLINQKKY